MAVFTLKMMLFLSLAWGALAGLVQLIPDDDLRQNQVRAVLLPPDCESACLMNIRPGVTSARTSIELLTISPWVQMLDRPNMPDLDGTGTLNWNWTGLQPPWISSFSQGQLAVRDGIVIRIELDTLLAYGEVWQIFGTPEMGLMRPTLRVIERPQMNHYAVFMDLGIWVQSLADCPPRPDTFWTVPAHIGLGEPPGVPLEAYDLPGWFHQPSPCLE